MKKYSLILAFSLLFTLSSRFSFCQDRIQVLTDTFRIQVEKERRVKEEEFRNPLTSPLPPEEIPDFKGLLYFDYNLKYRVKAEFIKVTDSLPFKMKTTTSRRPEYIHYADVIFIIDAKEYKLEVFQNLDLIKKPGFEDYLFLPFTDETCGRESYGGGRYIDLQRVEGTRIIIDFNKAYNPYCSYNTKYSCPIPPSQNELPIEIKAGEKSVTHH